MHNPTRALPPYPSGLTNSIRTNARMLRNSSSPHSSGTDVTLDGGPSIANFQTPEHLKSLHVLMHKYIRIKDDIDRAGTGTYSPELRDEAQNARNALFHLLSKIPGKPTHVALTELIEEHPEPDLRPWMAKQAYRRAEEDGDLEPWSAPQISQFASNLISYTELPTVNCSTWQSTA